MLIKTDSAGGVAARGGGRGQWVKMVKRHKLLVINEIILGYEIYSAVTTVNNTVLSICPYCPFESC